MSDTVVIMGGRGASEAQNGVPDAEPGARAGR